jgi:hypothetical protein
LISVGPFIEVAFTGSNIKALHFEFTKHYFPSKVIAGSKSESELPLLKNRYIKGKDMIYVCSNKTCQHPVERVQEAMMQIMEINRPKNL